MTDFKPTRLFDLLPQIYRVRDAEPASNGSLEVLLEVIDQQVCIVHEDITRLWNDFFVETCDDWVVPYIGDLVGANLVAPVVLRARTDVAKTIHYRRRKGTVPMLEELPRDVTGWSAKAVEFYQILGWTQNVNHVRHGGGGWFDLHDDTICNAVTTAFDVAAHTVDVHVPAQAEGWHNTRNIGFFLWRLQSYSLIKTDPQVANKPHRFHFNALGQPEPLFIQPDVEGLAEQRTGEDDVSAPIGPRRLSFVTLAIDHFDPPDAGGLVALHLIGPDAPLAQPWSCGLWLDLIDSDGLLPTLFAELIDVREKGSVLIVKPDGNLIPNKKLQVRAFPNLSKYYGQRRGFSVFAGDELISPKASNPHRRRVLIGDLCNWHDPDTGTLVIDVRLGRFAFAPGERPKDPVTVSFNYGFSGDVGAGPYHRLLVDAPTATITQGGAPTLKKALDDWQQSAPAEAIIEIQDSRTYRLSLTSLKMPSSLFRLTLRARSGERPTIILSGNLQLTGGDASSSITLDGLFISGGAIDVQGALGELTIRNCTLDPGGGPASDGVKRRSMKTSLSIAETNTRLTVVIDHSIVGALRVPNTIEHLHIADSIIDAQQGTAISGLKGADDFAAGSTLERTTILGRCWLQELTLGSEVLFNDIVMVRRKQQGCVRFSYIPPKSDAPRRYHCLPLDDADVATLARLTPSFTSTRFGDPAYAQLSRNGPIELATGASDGSEIGAFFSLKNPLRRQNLVMRLDEYLPFGLAAALIEVT